MDANEIHLRCFSGPAGKGQDVAIGITLYPCKSPKEL